VLFLTQQKQYPKIKIKNYNYFVAFFWGGGGGLGGNAFMSDNT
jgi:hypothetical protein